jgi:hypothetical protein
MIVRDKTKHDIKGALLLGAIGNAIVQENSAAAL